MSELIKVCNQNEYVTCHKVDWKVFDNWNEYYDIYFNKLEAIKKYQIFQAGNKFNGMVECYEPNLDDVDPVQDFLLKQDLPAIVPDKPNKLYKERKGIRDIKAVIYYMRVFMI